MVAGRKVKSARAGQNLVIRRLREHIEVCRNLYALEDTIAAAGAALVKVIQGGGMILFLGCGGSAAMAQHLAAELLVRFRENRRPLPGIAVADPAVLTAAANDFGWAQALARPVLALAGEGDAVLCLSTSGESEAVLEAARAAVKVGALLVALTGAGPNTLAGLARHAVLVPSRDTARVQECHLLVGHLLCEMIDRIGKGSRGS